MGVGVSKLFSVLGVVHDTSTSYLRTYLRFKDEP